MNRSKAISEEVYVADAPIVHLGPSDVAALKQRVPATARKRVRLCAHKDVEDKLHEMFVVYTKETYIKPNQHLGKDESLHIIGGAADFVFFDDEGRVTEVVPLSGYGSGHPFYCRIPQSAYHTWIIRSDTIVVHESTPGPFRRSDTVFAPWAPDEGDTAGIGAFMSRLTDAIGARMSRSERGGVGTDARWMGITPDVYVAHGPIVTVDCLDVEFLKERVQGSSRKRTRLCAHKDTDDRLQEMMIAFARGSYIRPSRHVNKEESIHIIEGAADFVLFDEDGRVREVIPLGDDSSGRQFYCRTPEGTYHTVLIRSDVLVVQETTQGPFRRSDTVFAPWAPEDGDAVSTEEYLRQLAREVDRLAATSAGT